MDLSCNEDMDTSQVPMEIPPPPDVLYAPVDPMFSTDPRIIPNLLFLEKGSMPTCDYFKYVQDDIQPFMRKVVTTWMLEVCEEQSCEERVFPLAVNYVDRFLCSLAIPRHQLQLLASAALLLASKVRQGSPLPVVLLCAYTDNSISSDELRQWEILLLRRLQWMTFSVTVFDFIEHVITRTQWANPPAMVRRHAYTLAALCYTETDFLHEYPSITATGCIVAAARGLGASVTNATGEAVDALASVCSLTGASDSDTERIAYLVEQLVTRETTPIKAICQKSSTDSPGTPTDVQDVLF